ncbi:myeloid leukemia factor-like isoform X2 [Vespa mandarinia]|uniref:myeloid leukemia factor-like isoform X2 n=1 Tax=Vespa mandarinia TaxID=7446 RepID=UPI00161B69B8|nr:myeloid leukemia factor-like isoform X2 [Vespa mandarinia]XP_046819935.1 myeloid leukemia factor isoform X3 [Vespa crabro]
MSLFGSLMGDFDDDLIFGSHMRTMRQMSSIMNSFFTDPFGMMGQNALTDSQERSGVHHNEMQMMPFAFPTMPAMNFNRLFTNFDNLATNGNCHSFTSSSVMTMASGADGRPQVYQETMSTRTAPGGVKETKKTVCDTRTGTKKMAIGHHIGDRAHIREREQNIHNGEQEEHEEFINLDEDEAESFNTEWESCTRRSVGAIGGAHHNAYANYNRRRPDKQLALPDASGSSDPLASSEATYHRKTTTGYRKRKHTPDTEFKHKRPAM